MSGWKIGKVIQGAIGPYEQYCDGCFTSSPNKACNYICLITLSTATVQKLSIRRPRELDNIVAFDLAEANAAYLGQVNFIRVTSFCGPMGAIWGYDLVRPFDLRSEVLEGLGSKNTHVYSARPLIKATELLLGTKKELHFPIIPGAQVPYAGYHIEKFAEKPRPLHLYCAMAVGIPQNRERKAVLWMRDLGVLKKEQEQEKILRSLVRSIEAVGNNQGIEYNEIFTEIDVIRVKKGEIGCAFAAMPYILLARKAVPAENPDNFITLSLHEWQQMVRNDFFCSSYVAFDDGKHQQIKDISS